MKLLLASLLAGVLWFSPLTAWAQYSNASLDGPWMMVVGEVEAGESSKYIVFDGLGSITDQGWYNVPASTYPYSVQPNGAFQMTFWIEGQSVQVSGYLDSDSVAFLEHPVGSDTLLMPLLRIPDTGACEGTWIGTFEEDCDGSVRSVELTIGSTGEIVSATGFAGPVTGRFYDATFGPLIGHIRTGETDAWNEIGLQGGNMVRWSTASEAAGRFGRDCDGCNGGRFQLDGPPDPATAVVPPVPAGATTLQLGSSPNPFRGKTWITYSVPTAGTARLAAFSVDGRLVRSLVDRSDGAGRHTVEWDARGVAPGVYWLRLTANRETAVEKCVLLR